MTGDLTSHNERLRRAYTDVFEARTDYMPLLVGTKCPGRASMQELWHDTEAAAAKTARALQPRLEIGSDWVPSINIGIYQCIAIPSLFNAELVLDLEGSEPLCKPAFDSVSEAVDAGVPAAEGPVIDEMLETCRAALRGLPDGWHLSMPVAASPFDLALLLLGDEFLIGVIAEPEATRQFLDHLTALFIRVTRRVKAEMGQGDREYVTNRGIYLPGFRMPSDAIVNFSPEQLQQVVLPVIERVAEAFGPVCVHVCTAPAPAAHVLPVLRECDAVLAVDNWQQTDVFLGPEAPARMQDRVGIIGDADLRTGEKIDEFLSRKPVREVPRKGGRPIVMNTGAENVQRGRELYRYWRRKQGVE